jgi:hypothetical protein
MPDKSQKPTQIVEQDKMPPLGPMTKEETEEYYKHWNQLIGLLADCTEEEMAAFDSTLRHPPPPDKSGVSSPKNQSCFGDVVNQVSEPDKTNPSMTKTTPPEQCKSEQASPPEPFTAEEIERNRQMLSQLEGLLSDFSEEELAAFDSALRHPPQKSEKT